MPSWLFKDWWPKIPTYFSKFDTRDQCLSKYIPGSSPLRTALYPGAVSGSVRQMGCVPVKLLRKTQGSTGRRHRVFLDLPIIEKKKCHV